MSSPRDDKPIRVGVFSTVAAAEVGVEKLLEAGFAKEQITVISSDEHKEAYFREFEQQQPAGEQATAAAAAGGTIGALLGGVSAVAGGLATSGVGLLVAGGVAAWTGGVVGGLVGAMMTRGVERELADYYDQAVARGKILVAVEDQGPHRRARLERASLALEEAGAEPVPLAKE